MLGIVLVSHSELCVGMKKSCEMIVGEQPHIATISLGDEGVEEFREKLQHCLSSMEKTYSDIIMVSDIPNATPYNECYRYILANQSKAMLLSGMNLIMVIELAIIREHCTDSTKLADQSLESAKMGIQKLEIK